MFVRVPKVNKTAFLLKKSIVPGQGINTKQCPTEAESFNFITDNSQIPTVVMWKPLREYDKNGK